MLLNSISNGQNLRKLNEFNTWSIQGNLAICYGHTDFAYNDVFYNSVYANAGIGLRATKYLTPHFALSADLFKTKLHGYNDDYEFDAMIDGQFAILAQLQTGHSKQIDAFKNFQLYGYLGYGRLHYSTKLIKKSNSNVEFSYGVSQVIPIGIGLKYKIMDKTTLNIEYVYNNVNTDLLDGYRDPLTEYDNYSKFQIGIATTIFNGDKYLKEDLEWYNP